MYDRPERWDVPGWQLGCDAGTIFRDERNEPQMMHLLIYSYDHDMAQVAFDSFSSGSEPKLTIVLSSEICICPRVNL